jgi:hypothetical protein
MKKTKLYRRWFQRIKEPPTNDFLLVLSASSKSAVSGTGKTTVATGLAKTLDSSVSGFDAESQATLSAGELGYEIIPSVENRSAVIIDEAQGTPGAGSAMNKRRSMKTETIETISSILANRDKGLTIIVVVQQFQMLDAWLLPLVDAWLLIRRGPGHPQGELATHHKVQVDDYDLQSPTLKTPAIEDLRWPPLPADDPDYAVMERKKQEAKERSQGGDDNEDGLPKQAQMKMAQAFREQGYSLQWIADNVDDIEYSRETIRKETTAPDDVATAET